MGLIQRFGAVMRVMKRAKRPPQTLALLRQRPALLFAENFFEMSLLASGRMDSRLKALARVKSSSLVGCPFWIDIGSAVSREMGVTEQQLLELPRYRTSSAFDDVERLVIDLAVEMAKTPAEIPDNLIARLRARFDEPQLIELTATIAWENFLSRFNRVFRVQSSGFSEGAVCALPEHAENVS